MWYFIYLCEQQEGHFEHLLCQCFSLQDWTYGTPGIWWEENYLYSNFMATFSSESSTKKTKKNNVL
jgi:hypothetical protein